MVVCQWSLSGTILFSHYLDKILSLSITDRINLQSHKWQLCERWWMFSATFTSRYLPPLPPYLPFLTDLLLGDPHIIFLLECNWSSHWTVILLMHFESWWEFIYFKTKAIRYESTFIISFGILAPINCHIACLPRKTGMPQSHGLPLCKDCAMWKVFMGLG